MARAMCFTIRLGAYDNTTRVRASSVCLLVLCRLFGFRVSNVLHTQTHKHMHTVHNYYLLPGLHKQPTPFCLPSHRFVWVAVMVMVVSLSHTFCVSVSGSRTRVCINVGGISIAHYQHTHTEPNKKKNKTQNKNPKLSKPNQSLIIMSAIASGAQRVGMRVWLCWFCTLTESSRDYRARPKSLPRKAQATPHTRAAASFINNKHNISFDRAVKICIRTHTHKKRTTRTRTHIDYLLNEYFIQNININDDDDVGNDENNKNISTHTQKTQQPRDENAHTPVHKENAFGASPRARPIRINDCEPASQWALSYLILSIVFLSIIDHHAQRDTHTENKLQFVGFMLYMHKCGPNAERDMFLWSFLCVCVYVESVLRLIFLGAVLHFTVGWECVFFVRIHTFRHTQTHIRVYHPQIPKRLKEHSTLWKRRRDSHSIEADQHQIWDLVCWHTRCIVFIASNSSS